jgi:hypothetical protein
VFKLAKAKGIPCNCEININKIRYYIHIMFYPIIFKTAVLLFLTKGISTAPADCTAYITKNKPLILR